MLFRKMLGCLALGAVVMGLSGCGKEGAEESSEATTKSGMAVIDLNAIAKRMGRDTQIVDAIKKYETDLNRQLLDLQANAKKQFEDHKAQMEATPPQNAEEEATRQTELTQFEQQLNTQLARAQADARQKAVTYRQQLGNAFREQVRPVAQAAAASVGATTVLIKQDFVLSVDPAVDITEVVAARLTSVASAPATPTGPVQR